MDDQFARFTNSNLMVFLKTLLLFPIPSSRGWCLFFPSSNTLGGYPPFPERYLFLNISAHYATAAFRFLLTFPLKRPSSLDLLYHIGPGTLFSGNVPLCHATFAWWGTFLRATANSFRNL
jgi:hypothetical protein